MRMQIQLSNSQRLARFGDSTNPLHIYMRIVLTALEPRFCSPTRSTPATLSYPQNKLFYRLIGAAEIRISQSV
jgi:hypothetical protein